MVVLLRLALLAFVVVQVGRAVALVRRRGSAIRPVLRAIRWWMVALAPVTLVLVGSTSAALLLVPGLDWGWGRLIDSDANVFLLPVVEAGSGSAGAGAWRQVLEIGLALVFVAALAYTMPLFALVEERVFRMGLEQGGVRRWFKATVGFGLVHLIMGIPIAVALALSWGGLVFAVIYRRAFRRAADRVPMGLPAGWPTVMRPSASIKAVDTSAAAHLTYNWSVLALLAVLLVVG